MIQVFYTADLKHKDAGLVKAEDNNKNSNKKSSSTGQCDNASSQRTKQLGCTEIARSYMLRSVFELKVI